MKSYWNALQDREKGLVISLALSLLVYVYYGLLYLPLNKEVMQKKIQLQEKVETWVWMKQKQGVSSSQKQSINNNQLLTLLATRLKEKPLSEFPYQLQQTNSGDLQLTFEAIPFQWFIRWLRDINNQYLITVHQLEVQKSKTPGVTKLMILLRAG